ncbi:MAG TPA: hypothetical protein VK046_11425 [Actinomycetaceae bacterium]|nr:hypothetical protein [Actinomycetaceae bacterium]
MRTAASNPWGTREDRQQRLPVFRAEFARVVIAAGELDADPGTDRRRSGP